MDPATSRLVERFGLRPVPRAFEYAVQCRPIRTVYESPEHPSLVVVDKDVNVRNPQEAWWVALNNMDPERDVRFTMGPVDVLDHASRTFTYGSKMGIDATRKWPEEGFTRNWPKVIEMDAATRASVDAMWGTLGL